MGILAFCGFESGGTTNGTGDMHVGVAFTASVQSTVKRTGTYAALCNPTTTNRGYVEVQMPSTTTGGMTIFNKATIYGKFHFRFPSGGLPASGSEPIVQCLTTGSNLKLEIRIDSSGNLSAYNSALTLLGTGATTLAPDTWYRIEIKCETGTSNAYELKIDGVTELSSSSANLHATNHGTFRIGKGTDRNGQSVSYYIDDVVVRDDAFHGDSEIKVLTPTGNASTMQWSGSYTAVDEIPRSLADWVTSTAPDDVALFAFADAASAGISGTINAVAVNTISVEDSAGTSSAFVRMKSGATNADTTPVELTSPGTAGQLVLLRETDPNTSAAWTTSGVDAVEGGMVENTTSAIRVRCYWVALMVDYTEGGGGGGGSNVSLMQISG